MEVNIGTPSENTDDDTNEITQISKADESIVAQWLHHFACVFTDAFQRKCGGKYITKQR